jgi:ligand-binding sensor domain-containing protein
MELHLPSLFGLLRLKQHMMSVSFACILPWASLHAQHANITFEHYTTEQGLSAPVTIITQDKYGFLWFGTTDGLNRFDGTKFIIYRNMPGDSTTIPSNIINALHVDQKGRVWAATNGGLCYYDFSDDRFHSVHFDVLLEKLDQYRAHGVCSDSDGDIWFATRTILHRWREGDIVKTYSLPSSEDLLIKYVHADVNDRIWIGSNEGLCVFNHVRQ